MFSYFLKTGMMSTAVILVVLLVRWVFMRSFPRKYLYCLWLFVAVRLLCPVSVYSPVSIFHLWDLPSSEENILGEVPESGEMNFGGSSKPQQGIQAFRGVSSQEIAEGRGGEAKDTQIKKKEVQNHSLAQENSGKHFISAGSLRVMSVIWMGGIVCLLLWNLLLLLRMRRGLSKAVLYDKNVYECDNIPSPFVLGLVKPRIYIPFRLGEREREFILLHEKYHIRRRDNLVKLIAFLIVAVYWFHPLVWLSYFCMVQDMEMSCDEYVLNKMDGDVRQDYSKSLLAFAMNHRRHSVNMISFGETAIRRRVKNIMKYKKRGKWTAVVPVLVIFAVGAVCLTDAGTGKSQQRLQDKTEREVQTVSEDKVAAVEEGAETVSDGKNAAWEENDGGALNMDNVSQGAVEDDGEKDGESGKRQVRIGIYRPESGAFEVSYYTPEGTVQKKLQQYTKKLNVARGSTKKERKACYKEKELGYQVYFAGVHWEAYSGGWFSLAWAEENYSGRKIKEDTIIYSPGLYTLTEQIVREELDYEYIDVKEIKDIVSAELVYKDRKGKEARQEITDSGQLKKMEKLFSTAVRYMTGPSRCPFGDKI